MDKKCSYENCDKPVKVKGKCRFHYIKEYNKKYYSTDERKKINREYMSNYSKNKPAEFYNLKRKYNYIKKCAKRRNILFDITIQEYESIISCGKCHYCDGSLPIVGYGIDRKDSKIGYIASNCVSCCSFCNIFKGNDRISYEQMVILKPVLIAIKNKEHFNLIVQEHNTILMDSIVP